MPVDQYTLAQNYGIDLILPDMMYEAGMDNPTADDPLLTLASPVYEDTDLIFWEQLENGFGLTSLRGLGNTPDVVTVPGARRYGISPGYYGERYVHDEVEMTKMREFGNPNEPMDIDERINKVYIPQAAQRFLNRLRQTIATFFLTGTFRNTGRNGAVVHTDTMSGYRTLSPSGTGGTGPGWAVSPDTATPINDLHLWQSQLELGTDSEFGPDSKLVMSPTVQVDLFKTKQVQEIFKGKYGQTFTPETIGEFVTDYGLPKFHVYKKNYYATEAPAKVRMGAVRVIPDKSLIWIGTRPMGQKIARFVLTRNAPKELQDGRADAPLTSRAVEEYSWAEGLGMALKLKDELPWHYQLDVWFNGGIRVDFPSAVAGITYT